MLRSKRCYGYTGEFSELRDIIAKTSDVLLKNGQHLDNVLETLDLQQHSLGILAVLVAKFSPSLQITLNSMRSGPEVYSQLYNQVQEFIIGCNGEQVRFAPDTCNYLLFIINHLLQNYKFPSKNALHIRIQHKVGFNEKFEYSLMG